MFDVAYCRQPKTSLCSLGPFLTVFIILGQNYQLFCIFVFRIPGKYPNERDSDAIRITFGYKLQILFSLKDLRM